MPDFSNIEHPKKRAFLKALSLGRTATHAAEDADISRAATWYWEQETGDAADAYREALKEAKQSAADHLEQEAIRRATEGVQRLRFYKGEPIMIPLQDDDGNCVMDDKGEPFVVPYVEHEYSDVLLIFLLKGAMPEKYKERQQIEGTIGVAALTEETWDRLAAPMPTYDVVAERIAQDKHGGNGQQQGGNGRASLPPP